MGAGLTHPCFLLSDCIISDYHANISHCLSQLNSALFSIVSVDTLSQCLNVFE